MKGWRGWAVSGIKGILLSLKKANSEGPKRQLFRRVSCEAGLEAARRQFSQVLCLPGKGRGWKRGQSFEVEDPPPPLRPFNSAELVDRIPMELKILSVVPSVSPCGDWLGDGLSRIHVLGRGSRLKAQTSSL